MAIITRIGKGSPLTHAELDGNFQYIQDHSNLENLLDITGHPQYTLTADMTRYSVTSHTHPYLPLSGGTVTGDTVVNAELLADRVYIYSEEDATEYPFEIATWAQNDLPYEISMVLHNYSDSQGFRIDQVGSGHHITLNNTFNEERRPGVTGSGDFIRCYQTNDGVEQLWGLASNSNMIWYGGTNETAKLIQNKTDASSFGFSIECNNDNQYHTQFKNAGRQLFYIKEGNNNDVVDLFSGGSMTSGLRIQSVNGNIELIPKEDLLLSPNGNVGVNTSAPKGKFHVDGVSNQNGYVSLLNFEDPMDGWSNFKLKTGIPWDTSNAGYKGFMSKLIIDGWYYHSSIKIEIGWYIYDNNWHFPSIQCLTRTNELCPSVTGAVEDGYIVFQFDKSPVGDFGTFQLSMIEGNNPDTYDYTKFDFLDEALASTATKVEEIPYKGWNQNDTLYINEGLNANVGIGTNSPLAKLHVKDYGAIAVRDSYATTIIEHPDARLQLASNSDGAYGSAVIMSTGVRSWSMWQGAADDSYKLHIGYYDSNTASLINIPGNSSKYLTLSNIGKVGIGTSSPVYNLHVAGTGVTRFLVESTDNNQASFDLWGGGHQIRWITDPTYATRLYKQNSPVGNLMWIEYDGTTQFNSPTFTVTGDIVVSANVGIGTSSPETKLHIKESDTDETLQIYLQNDGSGDVGIKMSNSYNSFSMGIDNNGIFKISDYTTLGTTADRLWIDSDGDFWFIAKEANDEALINVSCDYYSEYKEFLRLGALNWFNLGDRYGKPEIRFWHKGDALNSTYKYTHSSASAYSFLPSRIKADSDFISFDFVTASGNRLDDFGETAFSPSLRIKNSGDVVVQNSLGVGMQPNSDFTTAISGDVLIMGSTGGSYGTPRLSLRSDITNEPEGPSIDLLEGNIDFGVTGSNGFRWIYNAHSNNIELQSTNDPGSTGAITSTAMYTNRVSLETVFTTSISANTNKRVQVANGGTTRPSSPVNYEMFFDTSLGKPIWYNGSDWVDATGALA